MITATKFVWWPRQRYSAVFVFDEELEHIVLIHKLSPAWQAGKANVPGGKVDAADEPTDCNSPDKPADCTCTETTFRNCAVRELREETGLDIVANALQLVCRLRYMSREGETAECYFYATRGSVDAATTVEAERIFAGDVTDVMYGYAYSETWSNLAMCWETESLPTMPNLPYLVAMARQCLRGEGAGSWPLTIYEGSAQC